MAKLILPLFGLPVQMKCSCAYHPALISFQCGENSLKAKKLLFQSIIHGIFDLFVINYKSDSYALFAAHYTRSVPESQYPNLPRLPLIHRNKSVF